MSAFFEMGGYGAFVWSAYGLTGLVMALLAAASWRRQKRLGRAAERARSARHADAPRDAASAGTAQ